MSDTTIVVNPATEAPIAELPLGGVEEADDAVARALAAGPAWRAVAPADRARLLRRFAARVEEHGEELAQLETANVGKAIVDSRDEVAMVAEVLYFYAGAVDKHRGATVPVAGGVDMTFHEPLGVVAAIVPWNFPVAITSWKVGPALATGNTIVVKPAEITPLSALRLAELALEAGIPEGVLQVVAGKGSVVGSRLVEHPDVAKVAFTGSTEVGRDVMRRASATIKRVTLELGGKSASVDLRRRRSRAGGGGHPRRRLRQCRPGLLCPQPGAGAARRRRPLPRAAGRRASTRWTVGDPTDPTVQMGPLVTASHRRVVEGFLAPGMGAPGGGAVEVFAAGTVPDGPGFWFPPTVVAPADPGWRMAREEIFGPVVAVIPFEDEEDAVRLANDTPYGLSGSIWTGDGARALRMARAIQSGNLSVNSHSSVRVQTSFGGMKQSGFGRELGLEALASYSDVKNVFVSTDR